MSEIDGFKNQGAGDKRYMVDPVAFIAAMVGGPLLVTLAVVWMQVLPLAALALGGPVYLLLGAPLLLWYLQRNPPSAFRISMLALAAILVAALLVGVVSVVLGQEQLVQFALFYAIFGAFFAPVWGAATGWLYIRLRREAYIDASEKRGLV